MTITAKFSSVCPECHNRIEAGTQVEWNPGEKATHIECPAPAPAPVQEVAKLGGEPVVVAAPVQKGTYTVVFGGNENNRETLKVTVATKASKYAGKTFVAIRRAGGLYGDYQRFAELVDGVKLVLQPWAVKSFGSDMDRYVAAFATVSEDPMTAGLAYAMESGSCFRCGRELTVPAPIHNGLGPECLRYFA